MGNLVEDFWNNFCNISKIPRQSGKEEKIADFLEKFAKSYDLEVYRDKNNNVLIKKDGNKEINDNIILQAHMDMVCVKSAESNHDFEKEGINVIKEGDLVYAKDTSLGADQGIGMAIMLSILQNSRIKHPNLECLFTTEEETTFNGAVKFDYKKLKGKKLINLDHCEDDSVIIGCDADICNEYILTGKKEHINKPSYKIKISGIVGGNSGCELFNNRTNAIILMAKILKNLEDINIVDINGGQSPEDIANSCECTIKTDLKNVEEKIKQIINNENINSEEPILAVETADYEYAFSKNLSDKIIKQILNSKDQIITKKENDIISSENLGIIQTVDNCIKIKGILRNIDEEELEKCNKEKIKLAKDNSFSVSEIYRDSAWNICKESKLLKIYKETYYQLERKYPQVKITHGSIECSVFSKNITKVDMISIGSIIENFHTINEKMYFSSCEKIIKLLVKVLEKL